MPPVSVVRKPNATDRAKEKRLRLADIFSTLANIQPGLTLRQNDRYRARQA